MSGLIQLLANLFTIAEPQPTEEAAKWIRARMTPFDLHLIWDAIEAEEIEDGC